MKRVSIIVFILILLYPMFGSTIDDILQLEGVENEKEVVGFSVDNLWSGKTQDYLSDVWSEVIPGKALLVKLRNEIIFSFLKTSPNENVIMGKNDDLYEPAYIYWQTQIYEYSDEELDEAVDKLIKVQQILKNKDMYILITPSKARFNQSDFPVQLELLKTYGCPNADLYTRFIERLSKSNLRYFDSVEYISKNLNEKKYPVFYKTGIHWSRLWGNYVAAEFANYITNTSEWDLPKLTVSSIETDLAKHPDADLLKTCNVFSSPYDKYYEPIVFVDEEERDKSKPNFFCRGGSFMGQSLGMLIDLNIFAEYTYFENNYYRTSANVENTFISSYSAYDEFPVLSYLENSDIVVFEINEAAIYNMSFGFLDYLLENMSDKN